MTNRKQTSMPILYATFLFCIILLATGCSSTSDTGAEANATTSAEGYATAHMLQITEFLHDSWGAASVFISKANDDDAEDYLYVGAEYTGTKPSSTSSSYLCGNGGSYSYESTIQTLTTDESGDFITLTAENTATFDDCEGVFGLQIPGDWYDCGGEIYTYQSGGLITTNVTVEKDTATTAHVTYESTTDEPLILTLDDLEFEIDLNITVTWTLEDTDATFESYSTSSFPTYSGTVMVNSTSYDMADLEETYIETSEYVNYCL
ncbi:MAG: hypothetical protein ABII18_11950 [bacterium]|nr:hypothetical protein [bacterium]MBU1917876.1 hypothetical protein [bacterium]